MNCPLCNYIENIDLEPTMEVLRNKNYVFMYDKRAKNLEIINPRNNKKANFFFSFHSIKECKNCHNIIMRYNGHAKYMAMYRTTIAIYKDNNSYKNIHDLTGDYYRLPKSLLRYKLSDLLIEQVKEKNIFQKYCTIL